LQNFSAEFLQEAMEKLEVFRDTLLQFESTGINPLLVNEAFRAIHTIKGSGAMVGFDHLARSVHSLETELDDLRKETFESTPSIDHFLRWSDYIEAYLNGLVGDPDFTLEVSDFFNAQESKPLCSDGSKDEDLYRKVGPFSPEVLYSDLDKMEVQNFPIQYRAYLQSSRTVSNETAWSLLSLSALNLPDSDPDNFASTALHLLRSHCDLSEISRICLVRKLGIANHYESLSSASIHKNFMLKGTRCFVHPDSSLTKIAPGYVRVLNFPEVMKSYNKKGLRPQRVANILSELGYKSGICIGVGPKSRNIGYLFLNADSDMLLDLPPSSLPVLSDLARYAASQIQGNCHLDSLYYRIWESDSQCSIGSRLRIDALMSAFDHAAKILGSALLCVRETSAELPRVLVSHANIAYLLARVSSIRGVKSSLLGIKMDNGRLIFSCELNGMMGDFHPTYLEMISAVARSLGYTLECQSKNKFDFSTNLDLCLDMNTQYSV